MSTAKAYAAATKDSPLAPWSFERRAPKAHDVQIEILWSGVCHSDIHQARDEWGGSMFPMVPGHEIVGRVTAIGDHVSKFKVGDLTGVGCMIDSCRECRNCNRDLEQYCEKGPNYTYNSLEKDGSPTYGGYSYHIVVDEKYVVSVSEKLPIEGVAPLLCAGITTYSPLKHWKIGPGHKVAVLGLGGLGHMGVKFAAAFGAEVTVLSTSPNKEADALALGAHKFVVTTDVEQIKPYNNYFDFILDTVSAPHSYDNYLRLLDNNGTLIFVGIPPVPMEMTCFTLLGNRRSVAASGIGSIAETQEMLDFCAEHNIVSDVEVINMDYINTAYDRMLKNDVKYRFVIDIASLK
ncbi:MAG: NAD(P)-dependent alcohol dehydrogenase [Bacteroidota bacterium]